MYAVYSHAASHRITVHAADGAKIRDVAACPVLGSVNGNEGGGVVSGVTGSWHGDEVWVEFQSFVQPLSIYRYDFDDDELTGYHVPDAAIDAVTEQVWYESMDGTQVSMFVVRPKGDRRTTADAAQRVRRVQHRHLAVVLTGPRGLARDRRGACLRQHSRRW